MHFFGWICLAENAPLIRQRIAMRNIKFVIFHPKEYRLAPKSAADFAFLLHGFYFLDKEGTMAIILPHGVLFRGGAEAEIREKLLKDGRIDTVIGLPAAKLITFSGLAVLTYLDILRLKSFFSISLNSTRREYRAVGRRFIKISLTTAIIPN
jgi:hypothetical protein